MEISLRNLKTRTAKKEGIAVYLTHDLSMLRLIETFSESAPQLILMITVILQREDVEWVTGTAVNHMFTIQRSQKRLTHGDRHCSVQ